MRATLKHIHNHGPAISSYFFEPEHQFRFVPGEYTELYVPHNSPDNRGESRKFTIASAPRASLIEIITTFSTPASTFKRALRKLQPGDTVQLSETTGDFVLPKDTAIPLRFVAAGIGISPALSMARWLQHTNEHRDVAIVHGASDKAAFTVAADIVAGQAQYTPILRRADPLWTGQTGSLSGERILQILQPPANSLIYLAGPEKLIETWREQLLQQGVASSQIVTDLFTGY